MKQVSFLRRMWTCLPGMLLIALTSTQVSAQVARRTLTNLLSTVEIGKEGACDKAGYPNILPDLVKLYLRKRSLLSSQLIGAASIAKVTRAQQATYQPYKGLSFLPNGATLPPFLPPTDSSKIYRITYLSGGQRLSGLVVVPDHSMANGMVVYDHGTQIAKDKGAPSHPSNEACMIITGLAGKGRMLAMPDYIGYGVNNGPHPYPLGVNNAPAGIDIIVAAHELAKEVNKIYPVGTALAVTGYSEGGGNSFWLARMIAEQKPDLMGSKLTMIAPMSGPYDMTGAMAHSLIVRQPVIIPWDLNQLITFLVRPMLVAYAAQGAADYSLSTTTSGLPSMLRSPVLEFVQGTPLPITTDTVNYGVGLMEKAVSAGYTLLNPNPSTLMQPGFVNALQTTDNRFPAIALWSVNDNISWVPKNADRVDVPTYITGILQDQIVPFAGANYPVPRGYTGGAAIFQQGNSQNLIASLREKSVGPSKVAWCGIDARQVPSTIMGKQVMLRINHLTGLPPVLTLAAKAIETGSIETLPTIPDPKP